jgi:hypothetical protein
VQRFTRRRLLATAPALALPLLGCRSTDAPAPTTIQNEVRPVLRVVSAVRATDGAGVRLVRSIGARALPMLDPFLLLDEIRSEDAGDYIKGFPDHPHRGFETVTYMIDGAMEHKDSVGNHGRLVGGSVQWMTAGRGIVHSELPKQEQGLLWGFQLWVNLPKRLKTSAPRYQDIPPQDVTEIGFQGARARVLAGSLGDARGPVDGIVVAPTMLDVTLGASGAFQDALVESHNAFAYVLDGAVHFGAEETLVARGELAVFGAGPSVRARTQVGGRFLLLAAEPIGEPVARRGPFVMNTEAELDQAFADYRAGRLVH